MGSLEFCGVGVLQWPSILQDEDEQSGQNLKAISWPLFHLACLPHGECASLYISTLSAALGAPRNNNHLWQRVFRSQATADAAPPFMEYEFDRDCAYDMISQGSDFHNIGHITNSLPAIHRNFHVCIAWASNSLSLGLPSFRNASDRQQGGMNIAQFFRNEQGRLGMENSNSLHEYFHIRVTNFLNLFVDHSAQGRYAGPLACMAYSSASLLPC